MGRARPIFGWRQFVTSRTGFPRDSKQLKAQEIFQAATLPSHRRNGK
jgi:hypothetical protein